MFLSVTSWGSPLGSCNNGNGKSLLTRVIVGESLLIDIRVIAGKSLLISVMVDKGLPTRIILGKSVLTHLLGCPLSSWVEAVAPDPQCANFLRRCHQELQVFSLLPP